MAVVIFDRCPNIYCLGGCPILFSSQHPLCSRSEACLLRVICSFSIFSTLTRVPLTVSSFQRPTATAIPKLTDCLPPAYVFAAQIGSFRLLLVNTILPRNWKRFLVGRQRLTKLARPSRTRHCKGFFQVE